MTDVSHHSALGRPAVDTAVTTAPVPAPVSVLIVDDDERYVSFVSQAFETNTDSRIQLIHVRRLSEIWHVLRATAISVVLLDVELPDGNGLEWLRQNRSRLESAVIVLTGHAEYNREAELDVAQDFMVKWEVEPAHLVRAVRYAADRERVRQQLLRSREYFQSLIDQARDLITVVDEQGVIVYQSPACTVMLGLPPDAFVGRPLLDFVELHDAPRVRHLLAASFAGGETPPAGEFNIRHADGTFRTVETVASRIAAPGETRRVVLNSRDVTERRRAAETLRQRDQQLRQAQKMEAVGRLAGGIAHDFSNVLTVITGASERLRDLQGPSSAARHDIDTILKNCQRAASLTRQLLAFSRQQTLAPRPIDLGSLVKNTGQLLTQLIGEHIRLSIDVAPDVRPIEADPVQMEQVLMNLAINARDAMPAGGSLRVLVRNMDVSEDFARTHAPMPLGPFVHLMVSDTGCGMTAETKAHAFEPFFTTKDPVHGTGLGLSTVYGIIKQSGGYVYIDSEQGVGTTFDVYMQPTWRPVVEEPPRHHRHGPVRAATILLTEDEDDVRELLTDVLEAQGYSVVAANGPDDAYAAASKYTKPIDLLLTDVVMPGGTGPDLARRLTAVRPGLKILFISGYPEHGSSANGSVLDAGVPFLQKPFTRDLLLEKVREILG
jgi:two-component system cell cycle sensor histidine kinase/response regulator CckA